MELSLAAKEAAAHYRATDKPADASATDMDARTDDEAAHGLDDDDGEEDGPPVMQVPPVPPVTQEPPVPPVTQEPPVPPVTQDDEEEPLEDALARLALHSRTHGATALAGELVCAPWEEQVEAMRRIGLDDPRALRGAFTRENGYVCPSQECVDTIARMVAEIRPRRVVFWGGDMRAASALAATLCSAHGGGGRATFQVVGDPDQTYPLSHGNEFSCDSDANWLDAVVFFPAPSVGKNGEHILAHTLDVFEPNQSKDERSGDKGSGAWSAEASLPLHEPSFNPFRDVVYVVPADMTGMAKIPGPRHTIAYGCVTPLLALEVVLQDNRRCRPVCYEPVGMATGRTAVGALFLPVERCAAWSGVVHVAPAPRTDDGPWSLAWDAAQAAVADPDYRAAYLASPPLVVRPECRAHVKWNNHVVSLQDTMPDTVHPRLADAFRAAMREEEAAWALASAGHIELVSDPRLLGLEPENVDRVEQMDRAQLEEYMAAQDQRRRMLEEYHRNHMVGQELLPACNARVAHEGADSRDRCLDRFAVAAARAEIMHDTWELVSTFENNLCRVCIGPCQTVDKKRRPGIVWTCEGACAAWADGWTPRTRKGWCPRSVRRRKRPAAREE